MKTTLFLLILAACLLAVAVQGREPDLYLATRAAYEQAAIAQAKASPEVAALRERLAKSQDPGIRSEASARLNAIFAAAVQGARAKAAAEEARRREARDAEIHARWEAEADRQALIDAIGQLRRP